MMQGLIMAAGKGSRIYCLTDGEPKSFLEIGGEKLIERNVRMLEERGVTDITLVVGYHDDVFRKLFSTHPNIHFVYNPFYPLANVISSYWMARHAVSEDFVYLHADTICEDALFDRLLSHAGDIVLPVDTKPCDEEAMKVQVVDGKVVRITKQMPVSAAAGEFIGIARFSSATVPALAQAADDVLREQRFDEYFEAAIQCVLDRHLFDAEMLDTDGLRWQEVDFEEDYRRAQQLFGEERKA